MEARIIPKMFVCCFAVNKFSLLDSDRWLTLTDEKKKKQDWEISDFLNLMKCIHSCVFKRVEKSMCACTCLCSCEHIKTPGPVLYSHYCHLTFFSAIEETNTWVPCAVLLEHHRKLIGCVITWALRS